MKQQEKSAAPKVRVPRPRLEADPTILEKAGRPEGFGPLEGSHLSLNLHRVCRRMVAKGMLHQAKASKHLVRYFLTAQAAAAFVEASKKKPKPPKPPRPPRKSRLKVPAPGQTFNRQKTALLKAAINRFTGSPAGFSVANFPPELTRPAIMNHLRLMVIDGKLFSATVEGAVMHFFTSQEAADAFRAAYVIRAAAKKAAYSVSYVLKNKPVAFKPAACKPKPKPVAVKVAKIIKKAPNNIVITRRPPEPMKPKVDAVIVWPDNYKRTVMVTPAPRFSVDLPLVRIGQPGWSMSVGGAA